MIDDNMLILLGIVAGLLVLGSLIAEVGVRVARTDGGVDVAKNLKDRMRSWWLMATVFAVSVLVGGVMTVVLFGVSSFLALREFITLTPTRRGDHRALFWAFFVIIPVQYVLVAQERYGAFLVFIPVFAFLLIPARMAAAGETEGFLGRMSRIQWGLMTCVYFIGHVPALLALDIAGYEGTNATLLFFFILIVQINDVSQFVVGKLIGKRPIAPLVSPNKTVAGMVGGLTISAAVGSSLSWITPFGVIDGATIALCVAFMGFMGDLTMSAVKRDIGVKDYSQAIPGHGGVLDRLDSLTFAAPVFFHIVRYFYTGQG
ncbi:MAG: phosphatidate cytidylyltransferase [Phycisphaerales bacterium]